MTTTISDAQSDKSFKVLFSKIQDFGHETLELVKTASVDYEELENLPSTAFAWPEMRKFAMHNKEHTALSLVYAHDEDVPSNVVATLEKAAELYGIAVEASQISKTASVINAPVTLASDYLLPEQELCKIASAGDIELGIEFLKRNRNSLDVMSAAHANKVLCKKASELKVDLPIGVYQEAGLVMCNLEKLGEWLDTRSLVTKGTPFADGYTKLASVVYPSSKEPVTRSTLLKVATTIAILDEESGISLKYKKGIASPMSSVFNTEKVAEETIYFAGQNIPVGKFATLNEDVYAKVLGDDVLEEIQTDGSLDHEKVMDIMATLPADLQQAMLPYLVQS